MKRADVIDLIRFHTDHDDAAFNSKAATIANEFEKEGRAELAGYVRALISETRTFVPQMIGENINDSMLIKVESAATTLPLPEEIANDIKGIINATSHKIILNKFLFVGSPGTGKTETAKQIARILQRTLYKVNFAALIDSKLGATVKNIIALFEEVNKVGTSGIVLFDEIDVIAMNRTNSNDVREMGRATSTFLSGLDSLSSNSIIIATTNLFDNFDKALTRRFDVTVDFDRYTKDDLVEVGLSVACGYLQKSTCVKRDTKLVKKILLSAQELPYPGELENIIKTSIAFSDPNYEYDYLRRLYISLVGGKTLDLKTLQKQGFTQREMSILTSMPKTSVNRKLREGTNE